MRCESDAGLLTNVRIGRTMASRFRRLQRQLAKGKRGMRTLSFDPVDRRYENLYASVVQGEPNRTRDGLRTHAALCTKLERIGQVKPAIDERGEPRDFKQDELRFYVTVSGGVIVLEEEEYREAVSRATKAMEWFHASRSRELDDLLTWLEALPKQEATAPVPSA